MNQEYGTIDHYSKLFKDIITDVATGDANTDRETAVNLLQGFENAIIEMMKYHEDAVTRYKELHGRFLLCKTPDDPW